MFCQLERLRLCLPSRVRLLLDELPKSLDETYERILKGIPEENRNHAQRLLQCLAVAIRPLRVDELAEILTFEFDATEGDAELPTFNGDWRSRDQEHEVLSACSSLITINDTNFERVVQFSHFSVKEYLTSDRLATLSEDISSYHILPEAAHKTLARASLAVLLRLDDYIDGWSAGSIPLAMYAAEYWVFHARVRSVSSHVMRTMMTLFDTDKPHFTVWVRIHDIDHHWGWNPANPLYYSVLCGIYDLIKHLVEKNPQHINAIGGEHDYPLVAALHEADTRVAELLSQHGANVDARGVGGRTPLHTAIGWLNNLAAGAVRFLLEHDADVNAQQDDLSTPLHLAAAEGKFEVAQMLLERRVDVDSRNNDDETPLHLVSKRTNSEGCSKLAQLLLKYGARVDSRDKTNATALHNASLVQNLEVARVLLSHGAYINAENSQGQTPFHQVSKVEHYSKYLVDFAQLLAENGADVNTRDKRQETPLHLASHEVNFQSVRVLLDHGANVNAKNSQGQTPLHQVFKYYSQARGGVVRLLVECGADVNAQDNDHDTPLHLASHALDLESVRVFLDNGANVDAKNNLVQTPLLQVLQSPYTSKDRFRVAQLLVERGANANVLGNKNHDTALHLASYFLQHKLVSVLLDHGAKVNAEDSLGRTPLHRVLGRKKYYEDTFVIALALMRCGSDVNIPNEDYETPLHLASRHMSLDMAWILLTHGADINVENKEGKTPFQLVRESLRGEMKQPPSEYSASYRRARRAQGVELMSLLYGY